MFSKQILLAGIAAGAFAVAGSASALSISSAAGCTSTNGVIPAASATCVITPSAQSYNLAKELTITNVASTAGQFKTVITPNTAIPPGTYQVTITYANATLNATPSNTAIASVGAGAQTANADAGFANSGGAVPGSTLGLASGVSGGVSMTYNLQVNAAGGVNDTVTSLFFAPALKISGPVTATVQVVNTASGANIQFEPAATSPIISNTVQGFAVAVCGKITGLAVQTTKSCAAGTTQILTGAATTYFSTLTADNQIGETAIAIASVAGNISAFNTAFNGAAVPALPSPIAYKDLNGTAVAAGDVTAVNTSVAGDFTKVKLNDLAIGGAATAGTTFSPVGATGAAAVSVAATGAPLEQFFTLTNTGTGPIPASAYNAAASLNLGAAFTSPAAVTGPFETVGTQGINYVVPWVNSAAQAAGSGNSTVIRISNLASAVQVGGVSGVVYGILYNPSAAQPIGTIGNYVKLGTLGTPASALAVTGTPGVTNSPATSTPTNSNELVITSADLTNAFGSFGRGDLRLVIQASGLNAAGTNSTNLQEATQNTGTGTVAVPVVSNILPGSSSFSVRRVFSNNANGNVSEMTVNAGDANTPNPVTSSIPQ